MVPTVLTSNAQASFTCFCILYKWNHAIRALLLLVIFAQHYVCDIHQCCRLEVLFFNSHSCMIYGYISRPQFIYLFTSWWIFGLLLTWSYYEFSCFENSYVHLLVNIALILVGQILRDREAGSSNKCLFSFSRSCQAICQSCSTNLDASA